MWRLEMCLHFVKLSLLIRYKLCYVTRKVWTEKGGAMSEAMSKFKFIQCTDLHEVVHYDICRWGITESGSPKCGCGVGFMPIRTSLSKNLVHTTPSVNWVRQQYVLPWIYFQVLCWKRQINRQPNIRLSARLGCSCSQRGNRETVMPNEDKGGNGKVFADIIYKQASTHLLLWIHHLCTCLEKCRPLSQNIFKWLSEVLFCSR